MSVTLITRGSAGQGAAGQGAARLGKVWHGTFLNQETKNTWRSEKQ